MENWDNDAEAARFYDGNFFPPDLVLNPLEIEILAASDDTLPPENEASSQPSSDRNLPVDASGLFLAEPDSAEPRGENKSRSSRSRSKSAPPKPEPCATEEIDDYGDYDGEGYGDYYGDEGDGEGEGGSYGDSSKITSNQGAAGAGAPSNKSRRRLMIAAASRATRQKRKREREELKKRNEQLEKDRDVYLTRIAELQTEVQGLRNSGTINVAKENELLRIEIRKHKAFIRSILAMADYMALNHLNTRSPAHFGVQLLPRGCNLAAAKRCNIRVDLPLRPESMQEIRKRLWKARMSPEVYARTYSGPWAHNALVSIAEIPTGFSELQTPQDPDIRVFHYTEELGLTRGRYHEKRSRDCTLVATWKPTKLITTSSFPENPLSPSAICHSSAVPFSYSLNPPAEAFESVSKDDPEACIIICSTSVNTDVFKSQQAGVHRINSPSIEGAIIRPGPNYEGCYLTFIVSWPLCEDGYTGFTNDNNLVNSDFSCGTNGDAFFTTKIGVMNSVLPDPDEI
eukprot:CAMPEP_0171574808 /NCGR_PEP_ID=MMETSP0961-20121227/5592_1 /TAXON_ID=87120 /ORGANISM="Aurantiochytrium limacinum, Strain ATCCMYA-1381" /LENGTH=512 /DNA_ID=CAMNT_0012130223 /DNA_START=129 /DNA_END=1668 /DNA_ORIENTATION=+